MYAPVSIDPPDKKLKTKAAGHWPMTRSLMFPDWSLLCAGFTQLTLPTCPLYRQPAMTLRNGWLN